MTHLGLGSYIVNLDFYLDRKNFLSFSIFLGEPKSHKFLSWFNLWFITKISP